MGGAISGLGGEGTSAVGGIGGAILGNNAAQSGYSKAIGEQEKAIANYENTKAPTADDLKVTLDKLVSAGQLNPEDESAILQGPSAMNGVTADPQALAAQKGALAKLQQISNSTTLDPIAQAQLNQSIAATNANNQSNQNAILQSEAQRGMSGSGSELAQRLSANQSNATTASNAGFSAAADAQARALQALSQSGQLGNQIQNTQFGEAAAKAGANDAISRFNTQNSQNVANTNVNTHNIAQQQNLQNAQNISNQNTGIANNNMLYNAGTNQTAYNDQMGKNAAEANLYSNIGNLQTQKGKTKQQEWAGIGSGVAQLGSAGNGSGGGGGGGGSSGMMDMMGS